MKPIHFFVLLLSASALASPAKIQTGTYGTPLVSNLEQSASFELKPGGKATVTPGQGKAIPGKWRAVEGGIELKFGEYRDFLKSETDRQECLGRPCFVFGQSLARTFVKSPLKIDSPFTKLGSKQ